MAPHSKHKRRAQWTGAIGATIAGVSERYSSSPRRSRRALLAVAVVVIALAILLPLSLGGGGATSEHQRPGSRAREESSSGRGTGTPGASPSPLESSGESPEIRRLIALHKPIYCAGPRGDAVALTFDDGPGVYTSLALRKLRAAQVHATFFLVGRNLDLVPAAPRAERALGMVGDHTWRHPYLPGLSPAEAEREVLRTQGAVARASGAPVFLFRPPYGAMNAGLEAMVSSHHLLEILWDVDSEDSLRGDYAEIARKVIAGLRPGSIILMHENHGQTIRALPYIFAALRRRHLRTASIPQLLTEDPPSARQVDGGWSACGLSGALSGAGG